MAPAQDPRAEPAAPVGGSTLRAAAGGAVGVGGPGGAPRAPRALPRAPLHRPVQHGLRARAPAALSRARAQAALAAGPVQRAAAVPAGPAAAQALGAAVQRPPGRARPPRPPGPHAHGRGAHDAHAAPLGAVPLLLHVLVRDPCL